MATKKRNQDVVPSTAKVQHDLAVEVEEADSLLDVISSQLISFVLPTFDFDGPVKTIEDVAGYTFEVETRHQINLDYYFRLIIKMDFIIHFNDKESLKASAQSITSFKALIPVDKKKQFTLAMLPLKAVRAAAHIAYSTTRGLLIAKSSGTLLQNAILPVVSSEELVAAKPID